ncbi:hypothetical protein B4129_0891 [Bacillus safensis]|nr:hypothetical protein B4129_0891 [Bacillus safensis]
MHQSGTLFMQKEHLSKQKEPAFDQQALFLMDDLVHKLGHI